MIKVRSFDKLKEYIQKKINDALLNEIAEDIAEIESEVIRENVYNKYTPKMYERREMGGGLADPSNIQGELVEDGILRVENKTKFNPGYDTQNQGEGLAGLVEYGNGYDGHRYEYYLKRGNSVYTEPRPFIDDTREYVANGIVDDLAMALEDRGLKVKRL